MMTRQKPRARLPIKPDAALHLIISVDDHYEHPGEYTARWSFYFDAHRSVDYRSRWMLKTKSGAIARAKREAVRYLQELRRQIDEVLPRIESTELDDHEMMSIPSSAYLEFVPDDDNA